MDPLLLDYARLHGIASDYTAVDPHALIDDTLKYGPKGEPPLQHTALKCHNRLNTARTLLESNIWREKLCLSKEGARFLTALIRDNQAQSLVINWDDLLPNFHRVDDTKIDPPIFSLESESDVRLSKKPLWYSAHDIELELSNTSQELANAPNPLASLQMNKNSLMDQVKRDKLKCSKESFWLIQSVRDDAGPSVQEFEDVLGSILEEIHAKSTTPILRPLSADCLTSSPTPMFDEHMLPTPVSLASNGLELLRHHSAPSGLECEDIINKNRYSSAPNRESQCDSIGLSEEDDSTHDTPKIDIEYSSKTGFSSLGAYNEENNSMIIATLEPSSSSATKSNPSDEHDACNSNTRLNNRTSATTSVKAPFSEYMKETEGRKDVKLQHTQQYLGTSSGNELSREEPESLSRHVVFTVTKRPQEVRAGPQNQYTLELHGVHETKTPVLQSRRVTLGSLSSYMETRGRGNKRQIPAKSPYFLGEASRGPEQQNNYLDTSFKERQQQNVAASNSLRTPPIPTLQAPRYPTQHDGLALFISTRLLKTHLQVIQCLEGSDHPPQLIYRDYENGSSTCQPKQRPKDSSSQHLQTVSIHSPNEADIILSPRTGIVLTTSQATMQLYLPGHKSTSIQPNISQIKAVNSPLRESIYRLSTRYQQLYVFISHSTEQSKRSKPRVSNPQLSANKSLLDSLTSLSAFCTSLSEYSSITPLMIPSLPESAASWILALAHKHICQLPPQRPNSLSQYTIAFTPVNPKPQLGALLENPEESVWELFLRRMGLNPYAAHVVLAVLRRDGEYVANGSGFHESRVQQTGVGYLSRFVEMTPEGRKALFGGLLGERVLKRVDSLIERDWQCDCALNFDDGIE